MPLQIRSPRELHAAFERLFNAGDIEGILALYESGATLAPQPGQAVTGTPAIRAALQQFLALKGKMKIDTKLVIESGDLALLRAAWTLRGGKDPAGKPVELQGNTLEVVRRQSDGGWRWVIDLPFGGD